MKKKQPQKRDRRVLTELRKALEDDDFMEGELSPNDQDADDR